MKVSIIVPTIRTYNWPNLYNSVLASTRRNFELIFIGPEYNSWIKQYKNIKYIRDFGSPNRCQQIGLCHCTGDIITWIADDGIFFEDELDKIIDYHLSFDNTVITSMKYGEGNNVMCDNSYYLLQNAYPFFKYLPKHKYIINGGVFRSEQIYDLGGWDCIFDVTCIAHADLAVRAYNSGYIVQLYPKPILQCTHMPNTTGDHAPIHFAQIERDVPLYSKIYSDIHNLQYRGKLDINNWKLSPDIWERRFNV